MSFPSSDLCSDTGVNGYEGWSGKDIIYRWDKSLEKVGELLDYMGAFFPRHVQKGIGMDHYTSA